MANRRQKKKLKSNIDQFMDEYGRKSQRGMEPNDRSYDRKVEKVIKRMDSAELRDLLYGDEEESERSTEDASRVISAEWKRGDTYYAANEVKRIYTPEINVEQLTKVNSPAYSVPM